ncbi:MAG: hypothetical protein ACKPKO_00620, partial [Candidatus Fonsibacter sp.]
MSTNTSIALPEPTESRSNASYISIETTGTSPKTPPRRWSWPSAFPQRSDAWEKQAADEIYEDFISIYQYTSVEQRERLTGINRKLPTEGGAL